MKLIQIFFTLSIWISANPNARAEHLNHFQFNNNDTIQSEIELSICNFFTPNKVVQFYQNNREGWDILVGFHTRIDTILHIIPKDSLSTNINWNDFENHLKEFMNSDISNQDEIILRYQKEGKSSTLSNEQFFSTVSDGIAFDLYYQINNKEKFLNYNNPQLYLKMLTEQGLPTLEHQAFTEFIDYLVGNFDWKAIGRIQMRETLRLINEKK